MQNLMKEIYMRPLLEGAKHNIENCWWIIDYNRQSLDGIIHEKLFEKANKSF